MVSSEQTATIVIEARDRATRTIQRVSKSLSKDLGSSVRSAGLSMLSFTAILSGVGVSLTAFIIKMREWVRNIGTARRAVALLSLQLQSTGFSADAANRAVEGLRNNISRLALSALVKADDALRQWLLSFSPASQKRIDDFAENLAKLTGITKDQAFLAALEASAGNFADLERILGVATGTYTTFAEAEEAVVQGMKDIAAMQTPLERVAVFLKDVLFDLFVGTFIDSGQLFAKAFNAAVEKVLNPQAAFAHMKEKWIEFFDDVVGAVFQANRILQLLNDWTVDVGLAVLGSWDLFWAERGVRFALKIVSALWDGVSKLVGALAARGTKIAQHVWGGISTFFTDKVPRFFTNTVKNAIMQSLGTLLPWMEERGLVLGFRVLAGLMGIKDGVVDMGKDIPRWIWRGMDSMRSWLWGRVTDFIDSIREAMESALGINSPSKVMVGIGKNMAEGLAMGLRGGMGGSGRISQPLVVQIGNSTFARAVIEVVDGKMTLKEPGLGLT